MTILIAVNSFKESADSVNIINWFENNLKEINVDIMKKPISDGGDGFLDICKYNFQTITLTYNQIEIYEKHLSNIPVEYDPVLKRLFIESARIIGIRNIKKAYRNPLKLNSKAIGEVLHKITDEISKKEIIVNKVIIGIGGTATNDLGLGVCSLFGLKLLDSDNKELDFLPENFYKVRDLVWNDKSLPFELELIVDVNNPLLGENGAAKTFAPQKGASAGDVEILESGTENIINILLKKGWVKTNTFLSGAGGGLAAGLSIFFSAKIKMSEDFIIKDLGFENLINQNIDYVITGEGSFDHQSLMNKGTGVILDLFKNKTLKLFLCCGKIDKNVLENLGGNIFPIEISKYFSSTEESVENIERGIELACKEIISEIKN